MAQSSLPSTELPVLTTAVRGWHGAPALFINGEPHTGLMFWHSKILDAGLDVAGFAGAGVNLITAGFNAMPLAEDGTFDFSHVDRNMAAILAANPQALVLPRVGLEPPAWWRERYPEEYQLHRDAGNGDEFRWRPSFASARWRELVAQALPEFIKYCEKHYAGQIFGYHLCGGDCGEWSYSWRQVVSDFSAPQQEAFRAWLRERYQDDEEVLRGAWDDPQVTFDTVEIPADRLRPANAWPRPWSLLDPATERRIIDYQSFHSEIVADAIVYVCEIAKKTLRALKREKVCGVFYGYHFFDAGAAASLHNSGHHAHERVLASPAIDFLCVPENYQERQPGGMYLSQFLPGSVRLHGKLYYNEDDTFVFLAKKTPWRYCCPDRETSITLLRRNFLGALLDGGTQWWMDHDGDGWYRDAGLLGAVEEMHRLGEEIMNSDRTPAAQVAVIASDDSLPYFRQDGDLTDGLLSRQVSEIAALGAPHIALRAADLDLLFTQPWGEQIRLLVFLDAVYLGERERQAIREKAARDGRTLLWLYAAGLATDGRFSPEAMAAVTGIWTGMQEMGGPALVESYLTGTRVTYGVEREIGPVLYGDDPEASVCGWLLHRGDPGLLIKEMDGWRSVWSAAPAMPALLLRHLARQAGAHIYSEAGDKIYATRDWLVVHAAYTGEHTIRLPQQTTLYNAFTSQLTAYRVMKFHPILKRGETAIWRMGR